MLYDFKRWERTETKPDVFSFPNFIEWLETKDPSTKYPVLPYSSCLLGQFASAMGASDPGGKSEDLGDDMIFAKVAFVCDGGECTFGAALSRARKLAGK
jgi:hypothetical protein